MSLSEEKLEELINAVFWKLYIPLKQSSAHYELIWSHFSKNYPGEASRICDSLAVVWAATWKPVFASELILGADRVSTVDPEFLKHLNRVWRAFVNDLRDNEVEKLRRDLRDALLTDSSQPSPLPKASAQADQPSPETPDVALGATPTSGTQSLQGTLTTVSTSTSISSAPDAMAQQSPSKDGSPTALPHAKDSAQAFPSSPETQQADKNATTIGETHPLQGTAASQLSDSVDLTSNAVNQPSHSEEVASPAAAQWQYLDVPEGPDKHTEFDKRSDTLPEDLKLIGARVRGKKHKHEGTNCDDWFEFAVSGSWTIIAVSDGAGSKKFSRVGAKYSCQAAVKQLAEALKDHKIQERDTWSVDTFKRDETNGAFAEEDLEFVQEALHRAMRVAYNAVEEATTERSKLTYYYKSLNHRDLEISDLAATLLLAVHTTVRYKGTDYSFVLSCQVGDGMMAAVDYEGKLELLAVPDRGSFAGETEFLTFKHKLERDNLMRKTFPFFRPLRALMVMTDGVADDYFPNAPGMLQLYGDLVLNQVIDISKPNAYKITHELGKTKLRSVSGVEEAKAKFQFLEQAITADDPQEVRIRSVTAYAEELGVPLSEVVASPALLWAGACGEPMCDEGDRSSPEEKLQVWLDSYYRRGSFDDRTLVVLYREVVE